MATVYPLVHDNQPNGQAIALPTRSEGLYSAESDSPAKDTMVDNLCSALLDEVHRFPLFWHSTYHSGSRETMVSCIASLVQQRRPKAGTEWLEKLYHVAKLIENRLYFSAASFQE